MLIHDKIKVIRQECNLSVRNLAKLLHCSHSYISMIENGSRTISCDMLESLKNATGYTGVPIREDEIDSFRQELYRLYDIIKNSQLAKSRKKLDYMQNIVDKCFEDEFKILYCLFDSYLLLREQKHEEARNKLEALSNRINELTDDQKYFYHYFYAASIYKDYHEAIQHFLKAENIAKKILKYEANLYYSLSNMYSRIGYSPKSIAYGEKALKMAQNSPDKAYLLNIEATLAFEYSRIGCYELSLDGLHACLVREDFIENRQRLQVTHHNLGCVYLSIKNYIYAMNHFNTALEFCNVGDRSYLNNKLYIAHTLVSENKNQKALTLLDELLDLAQHMPDMLLLLESAKHSLSLDNEVSLKYIENTSIPKLLKIGDHLTAIKYMNILSDFYEKNTNYNQSTKKSSDYSKLALFYTNKILKGDL